VDGDVASGALAEPRFDTVAAAGATLDDAETGLLAPAPGERGDLFDAFGRGDDDQAAETRRGFESCQGPREDGAPGELGGELVPLSEAGGRTRRHDHCIERHGGCTLAPRPIPL